jgi:antitoxin component YwqK of YwqJK toxin-antitoxin module
MRRIRQTAAVIGLSLCAFAAGCSKSDDDSQKVFDIGRPTQYEIANGGTVRRVFGGNDGTTLVEKHTPYGDGTTGQVFYRTTDGTVRLAREQYKDGTVKSTANYAEDGKTVVNGEIYRPDGTLFQVTVRLEDGRLRHQYFTKDGKHNFATKEVSIDGKTVETTFARRDKTTWAKARTVAGTDEWTDIYHEHGSARRLRYQQGYENNRGSVVRVTHFNAQNGNAEYKQLWHRTWDSTNQNNLQLLGLDLLDWQSNVTRGFVFKEENGVVRLVEVRERVTVGSYPDQSVEIHVKRFREEEEKELRTHVLETWPDPRTHLPPDQREKEMKRVYRENTLREVAGPKGIISEHEASEGVIAVVELQKLRRPLVIDEWEAVRNTFWSVDQNRQFLGHRDDTDPCRWYHK